MSGEGKMSDRAYGHDGKDVQVYVLLEVLGDGREIVEQFPSPSDEVAVERAEDVVSGVRAELRRDGRLVAAWARAATAAETVAPAGRQIAAEVGDLAQIRSFPERAPCATPVTN
jgi:hypothetical protein